METEPGVFFRVVSPLGPARGSQLYMDHPRLPGPRQILPSLSRFQPRSLVFFPCKWPVAVPPTFKFDRSFTDLIPFGGVGSPCQFTTPRFDRPAMPHPISPCFNLLVPPPQYGSLSPGPKVHTDCSPTPFSCVHTFPLVFAFFLPESLPDFSTL